MKDPRNWPRAALGPAAAIVDRHRRRRRPRRAAHPRKRHKRRAASHNAFDLAERTLRDAAREALRVFDDVARCVA